jgi:hypothetical protein
MHERLNMLAPERFSERERTETSGMEVAQAHSATLYRSQRDDKCNDALADGHHEFNIEEPE